MTGEDLTIGSVAGSAVMMIILRMIYGTFNVPEKIKAWIAVFLGVGFAALVLWGTTTPGTPIARGVWLDYLVRGFMMGASAIGLHEIVKGVGKGNGG